MIDSGSTSVFISSRIDLLLFGRLKPEGGIRASEVAGGERAPIQASLSIVTALVLLLHPADARDEAHEAAFEEVLVIRCRRVCADRW